jgi:hypothetical protein
MDRTNELIKRVAEARKTMQSFRAVEETARDARRTAEEAYGKAQEELRKDVWDQVDALVPSQEGDRC